VPTIKQVPIAIATKHLRQRLAGTPAARLKNDIETLPHNKLGQERMAQYTRSLESIRRTQIEDKAKVTARCGNYWSSLTANGAGPKAIHRGFPGRLKVANLACF
jgi:hypothetical protein